VKRVVASTVVSSLAGCLVCAAFSGLAFGATPVGSHPQTPPAYIYQKATVVAHPSSYNGPCAIGIEFNGTISGPSGSAVSYAFRFLRPGTSVDITQKTLYSTIGSSGVLDVNSSAAALNSGTGWVRLLIYAPSDLPPQVVSASGRSYFTVKCTVRLRK
jgi:hypothetical protein